jgi:hypothetical protein
MVVTTPREPFAVTGAFSFRSVRIDCRFMVDDTAVNGSAATDPL